MINQLFHKVPEIHVDRAHYIKSALVYIEKCHLFKTSNTVTPYPAKIRLSWQL